MKAPKHLLVMRFSSMGDVAMTVPVVKTVLDQNPEVSITFVSRPVFAEFFADVPRLTFFAADFTKRYSGFPGLLRLKTHLQREVKFYAVADLHGSLRTKILRNLFRFRGLMVKSINKGKAEKKLLTQFPNKV